MSKKHLFSFKSAKVKISLTCLSFLLLIAAGEVTAQLPPADVSSAREPEENAAWWYLGLFPLLVGLTGAIVWRLKNRSAEKEIVSHSGKKDKNISDENKADPELLHAEEEMEWLQRNQKRVGKIKAAKKDLPYELPPGHISEGSEPAEANLFSDPAIKQKIADLQISRLPVFNIEEIEPAAPFAPLPLSNDEALMSALEQTYEEFEEDEVVRDLAVRILAAFKTRNSVDALAQVALYDLSAALRSKAVGILTDFDHESVFETVLLACADPSREVRAAAARGLFRLGFDRSDAWTRIAETNDVFRMRQAARAAIDADLVSRSFDRLIHSDHKTAYEAVTLLALLISAEETAQIIHAIENHPEKTVKLALLRVIELAGDEKMLAGLYGLLEKSTLSPELKARIDEIIKGFVLIPA